MNRFITFITAIGILATAGVAAADCISTCENNCLSLSDPAAIGLCISSCPAACQPTPVPACETNQNPNFCTANSPVVVSLDPPSSPTGWRLTNDGTGGNPTVFLHLVCRNAGQFRNLFQGQRTINPGASVRFACGSLGFPANNKCGTSSTCTN